MTREEADQILHHYTQSESLLRHARSVSIVMEAYAEKFGEPAEKWAVTGLLHDADYEKYPEQHPNIIVELLREKGEEEKKRERKKGHGHSHSHCNGCAHGHE